MTPATSWRSLALRCPTPCLLPLPWGLGKSLEKRHATEAAHMRTAAFLQGRAATPSHLLPLCKVQFSSTKTPAGWKAKHTRDLTLVTAFVSCAKLITFALKPPGVWHFTHPTVQYKCKFRRNCKCNQLTGITASELYSSYVHHSLAFPLTFMHIIWNINLCSMESNGQDSGMLWIILVIYSFKYNMLN